MATIELTDAARAISDSRQWILQRRAWNTEKQKWGSWKSVGYYTTLRQLIPALADGLVRESEAQTLTELLDEVEDIGKRLSERLTPALTININTIG